VRILRSAISPAIFAQVKSGPDVFADALVPSAAAVDARRFDFKISYILVLILTSEARRRRRGTPLPQWLWFCETAK
jgi:hypothetical protein